MTKTLTTTEELRHLASSDNANELTRSLARECLANREAQPVGFYTTVSGKSGVIWHNGAPDDDTAIYTAPPAPAVPDEITAPLGAIANGYQLSIAQAEGYRWGWNACRAAMLAQPVSQGYKLVPVEPTEEMIAAAMNCDDVEFNSDETFCVNFDNIYRAMLAATPEGSNG
ncbi:hypothetical protein [Serratia marcescens]|uniref:Phage protein n=1 Tax=Serratia marcescens TaxID=615 RepID=A0ABD5IN86_SERMA|nr:hypothetical protein [Serratia marcescens]MDX7085239.1 hypothetical protein [Serratia marcescens]